MSDTEPDYRALHEVERCALSYIIRDGWQFSVPDNQRPDELQKCIALSDRNLHEARKRFAFLNARDFTVMATNKNQFATINAEPFWTVKAVKVAISSAFRCPPSDAPRRIGRVFYFR